jgi:sugar lactone lactonase YvrE/cytochrome oxidase Cu insertion factor (SCO1/SenC/PrrC family)
MFFYGSSGSSPARAAGAAGHVRAPDVNQAEGWLNTDRPLSMKDLKGQVVVLDFWAYCCVNCMHMFPDLKYLEDKYKNEPVVIIGIHSGKFDEERDPDHIREAILRHNISHPVGIDSGLRLWNAYHVDAWPTLVVIDSQGYAVREYSGEGHREDLDRAISMLLREGRQNHTLGTHLTFKTERQSFKSGTLEFPGKVLADAAGKRLFISDSNHNRIMITDLDGHVRQTIGSGVAGLKDGTFASAELRQPQGLALSSDGKTLYIADTENHAIRAADLAGDIVRTLAGTGAQGNERRYAGPARRAPLSSPWDLARVGNELYIAMAGIHQIWVLDLTRDTISVFAGEGIERDTDGPNRNACFAQPSGLATDGKVLYVADAEDSSIRAVDAHEGGRTRTLAGSANLFGFGNSDGLGAAARFQHPLGVALGPDGTCYVADTFNSAIRTVDPKTGLVSHWLAGESLGKSVEGPKRLDEPGGISIADGTLYIADTNHHRVLAVNLQSKEFRTIIGSP